MAGLANRALVVLTLMLAVAGCAGSEAAPSATGPAASSPSSAQPSPPALRLVVIGDSIPYNSAEDCPGCTGFVDRYADALAKATGRAVEVTNLSQHNGLTLPMLLDELPSFEDRLRAADAIIVGIAHNSIALNSDDPCGTRFDEATSTLQDWSVVTARCARTSAATYRPQYDRLFGTIAGWRSGKPTILRALNKYSDWLGWADAHLTPDQERRTVLVHDAWNTMLCRSAERHGFTCADIYHAFNGPHGTRPSGDLLAGDYTHPSDLGNARIAQVLVSEGFDPLA